MLGDSLVERLVDKYDIMTRAFCDADRDGQPRAISNRHELGRIPGATLADTRSPFFAGA